jgi:altronate dehydratase small subunit
MSGFIVVNQSDNVATALQPLVRGEVLVVQVGRGAGTVTLSEDIPAGHKFALSSIQPGGNVIKYGESIGVASRPIGAGQHVHVHNVEGTRGRGDKA